MRGHPSQAERPFDSQYSSISCPPLGGFFYLEKGLSMTIEGLKDEVHRVLIQSARDGRDFQPLVDDILSRIERETHHSETEWEHLVDGEGQPRGRKRRRLGISDEHDGDNYF